MNAKRRPPRLGSRQNSFITSLFGNDFLSAGIGLMVVNYLISLLRTWIRQLWNAITSRFFFTLFIDSNDEAYQWLLEWLAEQPYSKTARNMSVRTRWGTMNVRDYHVYDPYGGNQRPGDEKKRPNIYYVPALGTHFFIYKSRLLWFSRTERESQDGSVNQVLVGGVGGGFRNQVRERDETITLVMLGYSRDVLQGIISDAMELSYSKREGKTWIYTSTGYRNNWTRTCSKSHRSFESVILAEGVKEQILDDVQNFLKSADWYRQCGVPWRRGYLLYGPPGTGKTSFILALAGKLNMSVCIVNLSAVGMSDDRLSDLLNYAPHNSILLLEDVDAAFVKKVSNQGVLNNTLTLSGLLNALDGIATGEGRIMFMTTNHIEKLAPALIRPGRVDLKIKFDLANQSQIERMFLKFYPNEVETAKKISKMIPDYTVSTAELQGFYMLHRKNPKNVLTDCDRWLKEVEEDKKREEEHKKQREEDEEKIAMQVNHYRRAFERSLSPGSPVERIKKKKSDETVNKESNEKQNGETVNIDELPKPETLKLADGLKKRTKLKTENHS